MTPGDHPPTWKREKAFSDLIMRLRKSPSSGPLARAWAFSAKVGSTAERGAWLSHFSPPHSELSPVISPERPRSPSAAFPEQRPACAELHGEELVCRGTFLSVRRHVCRFSMLAGHTELGKQPGVSLCSLFCNIERQHPALGTCFRTLGTVQRLLTRVCP